MQAESPAANAVGNARALMRLYTPLACNGKLASVSDNDHGIEEKPSMQVIQPSTIEQMRQEQSSGRDRVLLADTRFCLGFQLDTVECVYLLLLNWSSHRYVLLGSSSAGRHSKLIW